MFQNLQNLFILLTKIKTRCSSWVISVSQLFLIVSRNLKISLFLKHSRSFFIFYLVKYTSSFIFFANFMHQTQNKVAFVFSITQNSFMHLYFLLFHPKCIPIVFRIFICIPKDHWNAAEKSTFHECLQKSSDVWENFWSFSYNWLAPHFSSRLCQPRKCISAPDVSAPKLLIWHTHTRHS